MSINAFSLLIVIPILSDQIPRINCNIYPSYLHIYIKKIAKNEAKREHNKNLKFINANEQP